MKTLLVYAGGRGKTGSTAKCAQLLAGQLREEATVVDLAQASADPTSYERVIIGSPIYDHRMEKPVKAFMADNEATLLAKPLAFYLCMVEYDTFDRIVAREIPENLRTHARLRTSAGNLS